MVSVLTRRKTKKWDLTVAELQVPEVKDRHPNPNMTKGATCVLGRWLNPTQTSRTGESSPNVGLTNTGIDVYLRH